MAEEHLIALIHSLLHIALQDFGKFSLQSISPFQLELKNSVIQYV